MAGWLLVAFVIGLEFFCLLFGLGFSEADTPRQVWQVWEHALWAIPLTGLLGVWLLQRKPGHASNDRLLGGLVSLIGGLCILYWGLQAITAHSGTDKSVLRLIAALALMPALLLLSAGVKRLVLGRSRHTS